MARITGYDFMNMVMVFHNSLQKIITDINAEQYEMAKLRAMDMMLAIKKLENHVDARTDAT